MSNMDKIFQLSHCPKVGFSILILQLGFYAFIFHKLINPEIDRILIILDFIVLKNWPEILIAKNWIIYSRSLNL